MRSSSFFLGCSLLLQSLCHCLSFNSEGLALLSFRDRIDRDPFEALSNWGTGEDACSWFGVRCFNGNVVTLALEDLCLGGTLAPELGELAHMKYLILRNNSFRGHIPNEIRKLKQLEVLNVGLNSLSGCFPFDVGDIPKLKYIIVSPQVHELSKKSELYIEEIVPDIADKAWSDGAAMLSDMNQIHAATATRRSMKEKNTISPFRLRINRPSSSQSSSPAPSQSKPSPSQLLSSSPMPSISSHPGTSPTSAPSPDPVRKPKHPSPSLTHPSVTQPEPPPLSVGLSIPPSTIRSEFGGTHQKHSISWVVYGAIVVGVSCILSLSAILVIFCRKNKVVTVRPWATGLSGQLQKALISGVPSLKRAELETACEDFSNIIGSSPDSTLYKGTLSSGAEIAVISTLITSAKEWSKHSEAQFRKQIETLSKVNHKNFVNLLGYCEEEEPFTRMMVFEYAPNGTLFEHLHVKEAENLDWDARMRIAMGMAYCLEHMHQLNPPIKHRSLNSAVVYLTDDFAAKIADFDFWNAKTAVKTGSGNYGLLESSSSDSDNSVYNFGAILLEMMTGTPPYTKNGGLLVEWECGNNFMNTPQPSSFLMDPNLTSFREEQASALIDVIQTCVNPNPNERPTMKEVVAQLREITGISPDGSTPKLSPLWWAELEILSTEAC